MREHENPAADRSPQPLPCPRLPQHPPPPIRHSRSPVPNLYQPHQQPPEIYTQALPGCGGASSN